MKLTVAAYVLFVFENVEQRCFRASGKDSPASCVRCLSRPACCLYAVGVEYLVLFKLVCDLARSTCPFMQSVKIRFDHLCSFFVNQSIPLDCRDSSCSHTAHWTVRSFATLTLCLIAPHESLRLVSLAKNSLNQFLIPAMSLSVLLGLMLSKWSLMAMYADIVLRESVVDVQSRQSGVSTKP